MPVIGILGGTFDPVHNGHVLLATIASVELGLDRLLVVPASQSPFKASNPATDPAIRVEMLRRAFANVRRIEVSTLEVDRPPPSYTIDTIEEVARLSPGAELVLLLGYDALAGFPSWRDAAHIAAACRVAFFHRKGVRTNVIPEIQRALPGIRLERIPAPAIDISSTMVRERVKAGLTIDQLVPDGVRDIIEEKKLYR